MSRDKIESANQAATGKCQLELGHLAVLRGGQSIQESRLLNNTHSEQKLTLQKAVCLTTGEMLIQLNGISDAAKL